MMRSFDSTETKDLFTYCIEQYYDDETISYEWRGSVKIGDDVIMSITWDQDWMTKNEAMARLRRAFAEALSDAIIHPGHNH